LPEKVAYFSDVYDAVTGADAIVLLTEWNEYRGLDLNRVKNLVHSHIFIDLRNVYERNYIMEKGYEYFCIGR
jgi:UDPglucose 6-dehydrogenase